MTVAGKINTLTILVAATAGILLAATAIRNDYDRAMERLLERTYHRVQAQTQLQVAIYFRDTASQKEALRELINDSPAMRFARVVTPSGKVLGEVLQAGSPDYESVTLQDVRQDADAVATALTHRPSEIVPLEHSILAALTGGERISDLTIPVFSVLNPGQPDHSREDFGRAVVSAGEVGSLHVIGYVHIGISRTMLVAGILPRAAFAAAAALAFVVLCSLISLIMTRRITAPFTTLVRMADDIAAGREVNSGKLVYKGEFKELAGLLNGIIGDFRSRANRLEVDHQLLSMKVEERTLQLSRRNEELNRAVEEVTKTRDKLHKLAYYDSLTSLPNRRLFTEQLDLLLRLGRRNEELTAVLFLDLDNFKRINDSLGHSCGDVLLREVAKRLAHCVRASDLVGHNVEPDSAIDVSRLGGDEFTVVLNRVADTNAAATVARRLLSAFTKPVIIEGHELVVTPSIGIALAPQDADTVEGLLKAADTAMYHAKATGKNNFLFYSSDMDVAGVERLTLENDLRKAIEQNELVLYYQPQVDTITGNVVGAEALMRWQHPEQGLIPPFKFIPLAEELGLIGDLGEWGLERACRQMVELQSEGFNLPKVSVNVSALQFTPSFIEQVSLVLAETGLLPRRLELELTEGIMMDGSDSAIKALNSLKDLGVKLSIDDFGTGYSSLSYLSRFPLDELKIDRSFVVDLEESESDANLVIAIIAMARSLNMDIVAEGVENHDQYRFLRQHGASVIQGYMFSKPVPLEELKPMLAPGYFQQKHLQPAASA
ncbi:MAG: EAL domain-containing protein [Halioglobus sp.]|nr:EAL domain-containing protein [Halioglobus sp.]